MDNKDTPKTKRQRKVKKKVDKAIADAPQDLTQEMIIDLAGKTPLEYAKTKGKVAKACHVQVKDLEKLVDAVKVEQQADSLLEPHWEVKLWEHPVDAVALFGEIETRILHHIAMPRHLAFVCAVWVGFSWIHGHAVYSPILLVTSPERDSGKSTLLAVLCFMVRRGLQSVSISPAALYRSIEKWQPTFAIDEADKLFVDNPDLWQVINSGWTRGQGIVRCDPDTNEPRRFSTFCPKAIAMKGKDAPDTILSRSIQIIQSRRTREEPIAHFDHVDDADFIRIRSQLARWAADNGEALVAARPAQPDGFINRLASNWRILFAIADSLGEAHGVRMRDAAQQIAGVVDRPSAGVQLLGEFKQMFDASTLDYVFSANVLQHLHADPEKPWLEWSRGKAITEKGVAGLLHEYRIKSRTVGPKGHTAKGYRRAEFTDAWKRYWDPVVEAGEGEEEAGGLEPGILPSTRRPPCNDELFPEKSAVDQNPVDGKKLADSEAIPTRSTGRRENGRGETPPPPSTGSNGPLVAEKPQPKDPWDAVGDIPDHMDRTKGNGPHRWVSPDRRPGLGPPGDSLDDLK
jgi:hypothetical protein